MDEQKHFLSGQYYELLRNIVTLVLPAASTLYFTLGQIWNFPNIEQVIGTIAALNIFLGVLLGISRNSYNNSGARYDGQMEIIQKDENTQTYSLNLNGDPADLAGKKEVIFKVEPQ